jgi:hypothetical protein
MPSVDSPVNQFYVTSVVVGGVMNKKLTERFEMRLSTDDVISLDEWRRHQSDIPSRAEAIRRLVEAGLMVSTLDDALGMLWARVFALSDTDDLPDGVEDELEDIAEALDDLRKSLRARAGQ